MSKTIPGSCLCGNVRFEVTGPFSAFHMCHCSRCRKSTASAHASNIFAAPENIAWLSGEEKIKRFDLPSAKRFSKCFCTDCGSSVPYASRNGKMVIIPAGLMDKDPDIFPQDNIFWGNRAPWYDNGLKAQRFKGYPKK
jgi:hypothetical protein